MKRSHYVQNQLANVELLVGEYDMNESSRRLTDLGRMSRQVEGIGKKKVASNHASLEKSTIRI